MAHDDDHDDNTQSLRNMCLTLFINLAELGVAARQRIALCRLLLLEPWHRCLLLNNNQHHTELASGKTLLQLLAEAAKRATEAEAASEEEKTEHNVYAAYCAILVAFLVEKSGGAFDDVLGVAGVGKDDLATLVREFITFQATAGLLSQRACDSFERVLQALAPP